METNVYFCARCRLPIKPGIEREIFKLDQYKPGFRNFFVVCPTCYYTARKISLPPVRKEYHG